MKKKNLKGLTMPELREFVDSLGEPRFRAAQLFSWIYRKSAHSFFEMSDLSAKLREALEKRASIETLALAAIKRSVVDATTKFLFELTDGRRVESVLIPPASNSPAQERRLTLCVSTQVGCPLDCAFCATGAMGFYRNLTPGEIVDQVLQAQKQSQKRISNVVFMGMGEPMLNYDHVMTAIDLLNDERSLNIGANRITVSTAGYPARIRQMADEKRSPRLALSLHSLNDEKRSALMPINMKYPLAPLIDSIEYYWKTTRRRPTFEYILFEKFNDTEEDIRMLTALSRRIPSKINIIPFHSIASIQPTGFSATLRPSSRAGIEEFAQTLRTAGATAMVRRSAGEDIDAACGQLAVRDQMSQTKPRSRRQAIHTRTSEPTT